MLDDFTAENGATAVRPGTQIKSEYPWDSEDFHKHKVQAVGMWGHWGGKIRKHHNNLCNKYLNLREGRRCHVLRRSAATLRDAQPGRGGVPHGRPHPDAAQVCQADGGLEIQHRSRGRPRTPKGTFRVLSSL